MSPEMRTSLRLGSHRLELLENSCAAARKHLEALSQQSDTFGDGPDCSAEEAVYLAAQTYAITCWAAASAATALANDADTAASIACTALTECQMG